MSDSNLEAAPASAGPSRDRSSALFQTMVMQQANMALMFLGHVPHPETGQATVDLSAARFFIDQLEMLEVKTKGNLDRSEEGLLKQNLMSLRMAFVEAADQAESKTNAPATPPPASTPEATAPSAAEEPSAPGAAEAESRKKFSKKY